MRKLTLAIPIALLAFGVMACCGPKQGDPQPSANLQEVVDNVTYQWLKPRAYDAKLDELRSGATGWRQAKTLDDFSAGLVFLGDFSMKIQDIKLSDKYIAEQPSDEVLLAALVAAVEKFLQEQLE